MALLVEEGCMQLREPHHHHHLYCHPHHHHHHQQVIMVVEEECSLEYFHFASTPRPLNFFLHCSALGDLCIFDNAYLSNIFEFVIMPKQHLWTFDNAQAISLIMPRQHSQ